MERKFLTIAAILAGLSVALGAFGAHVLKTMLSAEMLSVFETGVKYQMYHALALGIVAISLRFYTNKLIVSSGWFFIVGIALFSGSLYALSISGVRMLGIITPFGGVCFLTGWTLMAVGILKRN